MVHHGRWVGGSVDLGYPAPDVGEVRIMELAL
jgi:hypothetical protein